VLGRDDLGGLSLVLDDTAPAAFDLRVALSAPPGTGAAGSIVQVRLTDGAEPRPVAAGMSDGPHIASAAPADAAAAANETLGTAIVRDKARSARETASPARRPAAAAAGTDAVGRRPLPEGASALGAVAREPDGPAWWQMPPPSWSPFVVGQERP
jgi:hypothetical protein